MKLLGYSPNISTFGVDIGLHPIVIISGEINMILVVVLSFLIGCILTYALCKKGWL